jgi:hypothetical protein
MISPKILALVLVFAKVGETVTIVIGDFRVEHLVVN